MLFCITFFCLCLLQSSRRAPHILEKLFIVNWRDRKMLSSVLAFRNKWTKSENKLCLRRAESDVGGHFYLQIFNVKWMSKVEYSRVVPCCCLCGYARHMGVRVDLCNRYETIGASVTPVQAQQWCFFALFKENYQNMPEKWT